MFENLCWRTLSSACNCQFFLWLWLPPKKRDLWNSDRGLYGKAQREKKRSKARECRGISVRAELAAKPTVLWIYPFSTARQSRSEGTLCELPALSHTPPGRQEYMRLGSFSTLWLMCCLSGRLQDLTVFIIYQTFLGSLKGLLKHTWMYSVFRVN